MTCVLKDKIGIQICFLFLSRLESVLKCTSKLKINLLEYNKENFDVWMQTQRYYQEIINEPIWNNQFLCHKKKVLSHVLLFLLICSFICLFLFWVIVVIFSFFFIYLWVYLQFKTICNL